MVALATEDPIVMYKLLSLLAILMDIGTSHMEWVVGPFDLLEASLPQAREFSQMTPSNKG